MPKEKGGSHAENEEEVRRIVSLLGKLVGFHKVPIAQLEASMGVGRGTWNRLYRGFSPLRYQHLLDILAHIGMTPERFFELAYSGPHTDEEFTSLLASPKTKAARKTPPVHPIPPADLEAVILDTLEKFLNKKPRRGQKTVSSAKP